MGIISEEREVLVQGNDTTGEKVGNVTREVRNWERECEENDIIRGRKSGWRKREDFLRWEEKEWNVKRGRKVL